MEKNKTEEPNWKEECLKTKKKDILTYLGLGVCSTTIGGILIGLPLGAISVLTYDTPATKIAIRLSDATFGGLLGMVGLSLILGGMITIRNKLKEYKDFKE